MLECEINIVREALKNENFTNVQVTLRKDFLFVYISEKNVNAFKESARNQCNALPVFHQWFSEITYLPYQRIKFKNTSKVKLHALKLYKILEYLMAPYIDFKATNIYYSTYLNI